MGDFPRLHSIALQATAFRSVKQTLLHVDELVLVGKKKQERIEMINPLA
jgi:hypothetical protein